MPAARRLSRFLHKKLFRSFFYLKTIIYVIFEKNCFKNKSKKNDTFVKTKIHYI